MKKIGTDNRPHEAKVKLNRASRAGMKKLSTYVHRNVWIAVSNLCINALAVFNVDIAAKRDEVIHSLSTSRPSV